jgi:hypothetical protein
MTGKKFIGSWQTLDGSIRHEGSLSINGDGSAMLAVFNFPFADRFEIEEAEFPVIAGHFVEVDSLKSYTIILLNGALERVSIDAFYSFSCSFNYVLIKDNLIDLPKELLFSRIYISDPKFQESCISNNVKVDGSLGSNNVTYTRNKPKNYKLFDNAIARYSLLWHSKIPLYYSGEMNISDNAWIVVDFKTLVSFEHCYSERANLEKFFIFLSMRPIAFSLCDLRIEEENYKLLGLTSKVNQGVRVRDVKFLIANCEVLFQNWMDLKCKIDFALESFHDVYLDRFSTIKRLFIETCFALEFFHKKYFDRKIRFSETNVEEIEGIKQLLAGSKYLEWFTSKFAIKKREVIFQDRIEELLQEAKISEENFSNKKFAQKIRNTRVNIVHLGSDKEDVFTEQELSENIDLITKVLLINVNRILLLNTVDLNSTDKFKRFLD